MRLVACGLLSVGLCVKRSIDAAAKRRVRHKMFIAAGSDFSGDKVGAEMQTAAQTGGGDVLYQVLRIKEIDVPAGSAKRQDSSIFHS